MEQMEQTSTTQNGLIWFGAAISIAEILTGVLFAPLGFSMGLLAILLGHVIGCFLFYLAGAISARSRLSAMDSVKLSFGQYGAKLFAVLNIIQLIGWTAVMIDNGASAVSTVTDTLLPIKGPALWCIVIGVLILLWLLLGVRSLGKLNLVVMTALLILTIVLAFVVFGNGGTIVPVEGTLSFGAAVELSVAMPLSWLPLVGDYTSTAKKPGRATWVSTLVYFLASSLMYIIGLGAALFTGEGDIAQILLKAGLGIVAILILIFSTVTTTFLDAFSAGVSFHSITKRIPAKWAGAAVCILGTVLALLTSAQEYESFLYLIGSVFAPMAAILITDFFLLRKSHLQQAVNIPNFVLWVIGFLLYRYFLDLDTVIGATAPVMLMICVLCLLWNGVMYLVHRNKTGQPKE